MGDQAIIIPQQTAVEQPWYTDINNIVTIVIAYLIICGVVTALVARHNGRSVPLGFLSGLFFGQFGVMTYMIMGEERRH